MTPEPNNVAFVQRIENARRFKINPLEEIVVTVPSEPAKHAFCMVEHRSAPNAAPPLHLHRNEDEIFEILEGQFRFWLDGEIVEASAGTIVVAPRNGTHTWKNVGGVPGRMSVTFIPGGIDGFFYDMEEIPHTDPRAPIIGEQYGIVYIAPAPEALDPCSTKMTFAPDDGTVYQHHLTGSGGNAVYIDLLLARLTDAGETPVLRYKGRDNTAADLLKSIYQYARALAESGIRRGSLVALFAPNCPDALAIRYAAHLLGAASFYLSAPSDPQRRADLLAQTNPDLLVLFPETAELLPAGLAIRVAAIGADLTGSSLRLDERAASQPGAPVASLARPDDLAVVISSGGTTGVPKGSARNFATYTTMVTAPSPAGRRQLINGGLAYLSQFLVDMTLLDGGSVVLEDSYDPADTLRAIESERITDFFLVEPQLFEVMDHPDLVHRDLSSLRTITHIGDLAAPTLRRRARERFGAVLTHIYGASEMGVVSVLTPPEHDLAHPELFTCAGRPRPGVDVRFRRDDGALAGAGEIGTIEVRSPAVAGGYHNRPDLKSFFQDGWFHSGDLGCLDADGYLHILGRADDIAWINGKMVSAALIQDTLCRLSSVRYAAVVMDAKPSSWAAAVVPWRGSSVDLTQCREAITAEYGAAFVTVVPIDRVPLTQQGKADRVAICQLKYKPVLSYKSERSSIFYER